MIMSEASQTTLTPHNQQPLVSRTYPSELEVDCAIQNSAKAQKAWSSVSVQERIIIGRKFMVGGIRELI
jgi:NAD-dependent aldehyde dehydrogenases